MRTRPGRPSLLVSFVLLASLAVPGTAIASHSWGGYHWARTANPFTVNLGDNVSGVWDTHLARTSADWTVSSVLDSPIDVGKTRPKACRPTSGRVEVCNAKYGDTGWLGVAQIWISGSHIVQGTAKVNDTYFTQPRYSTPEWRDLVMCQEVGHTFGLDHQDENFDNANLGTCMDYTSNPAGPPKNDQPNAHDYEQLETIYAHLDSTNTTSQSIAGNNVDVSGRGQWGRLVAVANGGRTATYLRDLGAGNKVVTFVIWA